MNTNKELLLKHIKENAETGTKLANLCQVLPFLSKDQVQRLLRELQIEGLIDFRGKTKASLWFPITK
jgi:predicted HTH transcriptional regulator